MKTRVSAIIPVHDGEATVERAIRSALAQTYDGEFEVIVVNDGSTDETRRILERFAKQVTIIDQDNAGTASARNAGARASCGEYLAFLDHDDEWGPKKIARCVAALEANHECVLVYSDARLVNRTATLVSDHYVPAAYAHAPSMGDLLRTGWWYTLPSAMVVRRDAFESCHGFDEKFGNAWGGEDSAFPMLARERGPFAYLPEPLICYTVSELADNLRKRRRSAPGETPSARLEKHFVAEMEFARFVSNRYGERGAHLARWAREERQRLLLPIAQLAMHDGDFELARCALRESLRLNPMVAAVWMRLLYSRVPRPVSRTLAAHLPQRLARIFTALPPRAYFRVQSEEAIA